MKWNGLLKANGSPKEKTKKEKELRSAIVNNRIFNCDRKEDHIGQSFGQFSRTDSNFFDEFNSYILPHSN